MKNCTDKAVEEKLIFFPETLDKRKSQGRSQVNENNMQLTSFQRPEKT